MLDSCFQVGRVFPSRLRLGGKVNTWHSLDLGDADFISLSRQRVSASLFLYRTFRGLSGIDENKLAQCTYIRSPTGTGAVGACPMHKISDTIRTAHSQDGAIVLDVRQGQMFNLNLVGSRILELLKNGNSESEIVDRISREFDVNRNVVEGDLREFLEALKNHKLIENQQAGKTA